MFDLHSSERLTYWKKFRDSLETSKTPFEDVSNLWGMAPFVSQYLDYSNPKSWPDPWHLIIDGKFDDLAICLGMLYTLQLTQRFMDSKFEIHMSMQLDNKKNNFFLIVNNENVLNYEYRAVLNYSEIENVQTNLIHTLSGLK